MSNKMQIEKEAIVVELKTLGYSDQEVKDFQKTLKCPRCGLDFSNLPYSGRWLAHLGNCDGKKAEKR